MADHRLIRHRADVALEALERLLECRELDTDHHLAVRVKDALYGLRRALRDSGVIELESPPR